MERQEFELYWKINRQQLLQQDAEWQELQKSYQMSSGADWLLFGIPVVAGITSFQLIPIGGELLKWIVSAVVTILCFMVCVYIKSLTIHTKSASEIERRVKEEAFKRMKATVS